MNHINFLSKKTKNSSQKTRGKRKKMFRHRFISLLDHFCGLSIKNKLQKSSSICSTADLNTWLEKFNLDVIGDHVRTCTTHSVYLNHSRTPSMTKRRPPHPPRLTGTLPQIHQPFDLDLSESHRSKLFIYTIPDQRSSTCDQHSSTFRIHSCVQSVYSRVREG